MRSLATTVIALAVFFATTAYGAANAASEDEDSVGEGIRVIPSVPAAKTTRSEATHVKANTTQAAVRVAQPRALNCAFEVSTTAPAKVAGQSKLRRLVKIDLPPTHPGKLAIVSPDGQWHYLHDELEAHQLGKAFATARGLELDIAKVKSQKTPKAKMEPVFRRSGTYTFYFAENLETEMANTFFLSCKLPIRVD